MSNTVDLQLKVMIENMPKNNGKTISEWYQTIDAAGLEKHGDIMKLLKGEATTDKFEDGKFFGGMCSHRVCLTSPADVDTDVAAWLQKAFDRA